MIKTFYLYITLYAIAILFYGCASTKTNHLPAELVLIDFLNKEYEPTDPKEIVILHSTSELNYKYEEIGVIKASTENINFIELKSKASDRGAHAIIRDKLNYILIRYKKDKDHESENLDFHSI